MSFQCNEKRTCSIIMFPTTGSYLVGNEIGTVVCCY